MNWIDDEKRKKEESRQQEDRNERRAAKIREAVPRLFHNLVEKLKKDLDRWRVEEGPHGIETFPSESEFLLKRTHNPMDSVKVVQGHYRITIERECRRNIYADPEMSYTYVEFGFASDESLILSYAEERVKGVDEICDRILLPLVRPRSD